MVVLIAVMDFAPAAPMPNPIDRALEAVVVTMDGLEVALTSMLPPRTVAVELAI